MPNDWKKTCSCGTPDHTKCKEHKELIFLSLSNPFPPQRATEKPQINIQIFDCLCKWSTSQIFGDQPITKRNKKSFPYSESKSSCLLHGHDQIPVFFFLLFLDFIQQTEKQTNALYDSGKFSFQNLQININKTKF